MFRSTEKPVPLKTYSKLDSNGDFSYFPGVTVVSSCYTNHKELCERIYKALKESPLVMEYYTPLPAHSYHMTTMDLHTAKEEQQKETEWINFVDKNLNGLRKIGTYLEENPILPQIKSMEVGISRIIYLSLLLSEGQEEQIKKTEQHLGLKGKVPSPFHITLAYSRPHKSSSREIDDKLKRELMAKLKLIIESVKLPLTIGKPELCYFDDMTAFNPWKAETNPFIKST